MQPSKLNLTLAICNSSPWAQTFRLQIAIKTGSQLFHLGPKGRSRHIARCHLPKGFNVTVNLLFSGPGAPNYKHGSNLCRQLSALWAAGPSSAPWRPTPLGAQSTPIVDRALVALVMGFHWRSPTGLAMWLALPLLFWKEGHGLSWLSGGWACVRSSVWLRNVVVAAGVQDGMRQGCGVCLAVARASLAHLFAPAWASGSVCLRRAMLVAGLWDGLEQSWRRAGCACQVAADLGFWCGARVCTVAVFPHFSQEPGELRKNGLCQGLIHGRRIGWRVEAKVVGCPGQVGTGGAGAKALQGARVEAGCIKGRPFGGTPRLQKFHIGD